MLRDLVPNDQNPVDLRPHNCPRASSGIIEDFLGLFLRDGGKHLGLELPILIQIPNLGVFLRFHEEILTDPDFILAQPVPAGGTSKSKRGHIVRILGVNSAEVSPINIVKHKREPRVGLVGLARVGVEHDCQRIGDRADKDFHIEILTHKVRRHPDHSKSPADLEA